MQEILKKLRPEHFNYESESTHALTVLYGILCPKDNTDMHHEIAKGLELLKSSILIIDDILDKSPKRNGVRSLYREIGADAAILIGEILKSQAVSRISKAVTQISPGHLSRVIELLENTYTTICQGQLEDLELESIPISKVKSQNYYRMIEHTSAHFIAFPGAIATILADKEEEDIKRIGRFGVYIGLAYQIRDDILDIVGDQEYLGKAAMTDIKSKKKRLPLIEAFNNANKTDKKRIEKILNKSNRLSKKDIIPLIELIIETNAIRNCYQALISFKNMAFKALENWNDKKQVEKLKVFSELLTDFQSLSINVKEKYNII